MARATSDSTDAAAALFEAATQLRDAGRHAEARSLALQAIGALLPSQVQARGVIEREIGFNYTLEGRPEAALGWYQRARETLPTSTLSSMATYHCLFQLGRLHEALDEALRFCALRAAPAYRQLFEHERIFDDSRDDLRRKADAVRAALAAHGPSATES